MLILSKYKERHAVKEACCSKRTSHNLPADVSGLSGVSRPSYNDEQGVFVEAEVEVCGRSAARLLLVLPLQHPAGRHVGNLYLDVMSLKKLDSAFYYREMTAVVLECSRALVNVQEEAELLMTRGKRNQFFLFVFVSCVVHI